ncbi:MAG: hypothetical protein ACRDSP_08605 [Pseudonocardiaceae bacterium]
MYRVETDEAAHQQIDALPARALAGYAELRTLLEVSPWSGESINDKNPDGEVRTLTFGPHHEGMVTYLILDEQHRVDVLSVLWIG